MSLLGREVKKTWRMMVLLNHNPIVLQLFAMSGPTEHNEWQGKELLIVQSCALRCWCEAKEQW